MRQRFRREGIMKGEVFGFSDALTCLSIILASTGRSALTRRRGGGNPESFQKDGSPPTTAGMTEGLVMPDIGYRASILRAFRMDPRHKPRG